MSTGIGFSYTKAGDGSFDLDPYFRLTDSKKLVVEAVWASWMQPQGSLVWAPSRGRDVRGLMSQALADGALAALESVLEAEAEEDDRVLSCDVSANYNPATKRLKISATVTTAEGPFNFVGFVDDLGARLGQ